LHIKLLLLLILTAIGLTPGDSSTVVHIYTPTAHRIQRTDIHNNKKIGNCGPCPVFASYNLALALQLRKKHGKPSVRVVEKCHDIPVAVVQYTFTHKQYTEQHNETEYTERNIHNDKNTYANRRTHYIIIKNT
jgi:hypothetical protein